MPKKSSTNASMFEMEMHRAEMIRSRRAREMRLRRKCETVGLKLSRSRKVRGSSAGLYHLYDPSTNNLVAGAEYGSHSMELYDVIVWLEKNRGVN